MTFQSQLRSNHATLQRNNHATLQRNNHATLQRNNHETPCNATITQAYCAPDLAISYYFPVIQLIARKYKKKVLYLLLHEYLKITF
jgi:hypothetical protein